MNTILVDFDLMLDTDFGLLKLIKDEYNNPQYIDMDYLNNIDENVLLYSLVKRDKINPLYMIMEGNKDIDKLLNEFFDKDYDKILKNSHKTNIFNLIKAYIMTNQISINILCKNIQEEQFINKLNLDVNLIIEKDFSKLNIDSYDCIFIKYFKDVLKFKNLKVKNIYVGKYNFNLENNNLIKNILEEVKDSNEFFIIDVYDTNINALG